MMHIYSPFTSCSSSSSSLTHVAAADAKLYRCESTPNFFLARLIDADFFLSSRFTNYFMQLKLPRMK